MTKKVTGVKLLALLTAAFCLVFVVACGGQGAQQAEPAQSQSSEQTKTEPKAEEPKKEEANKEAASSVKGEVAVQAAASLEKSLNDIIAKYNETQKEVTIKPNYGGSGTLVEQILQGAPADMFISANQAKMDDAEKGDAVLDGTRQDLLENELVLIVPKGSKLDIKDNKDLTKAEVNKVAIGEPKSVPAGKYATQSIESAGIHKDLEGKLVQGKDVTQVLTYVAAGEVDAGFVYKTDALTQKDKVEIVSVVEGHDKVTYPYAIMKQGEKNEAAKNFFEYLKSDDAKRIFEDYGFKVL